MGEYVRFTKEIFKAQNEIYFAFHYGFYWSVKTDLRKITFNNYIRSRYSNADTAACYNREHYSVYIYAHAYNTHYLHVYVIVLSYCIYIIIST